MRSWKSMCAVLALALAAYACNTSERAEPAADGTPAAGTTGDAASAGATTLADVAGSPDRYFGKTVTVVADVEEVFGPLAFALDEDAFLTGGVDNDVLVLSPKAGTLADIDDQWLNNKVKVTGTVGKMTVVEIEREVGWDLQPEIEAEVARAGAVIVATSIERVQ